MYIYIWYNIKGFIYITNISISIYDITMSMPGSVSRGAIMTMISGCDFSQYSCIKYTPGGTAQAAPYTQLVRSRWQVNYWFPNHENNTRVDFFMVSGFGRGLLPVLLMKLSLVNPRLTKPPLKFNDGLVQLGLTSLVKPATVDQLQIVNGTHCV